MSNSEIDKLRERYKTIKVLDEMDEIPQEIKEMSKDLKPKRLLLSGNLYPTENFFQRLIKKESNSMITFNRDEVVTNLKTKLEESLEELDYRGPLKANEGGLTDDLLDGLIEIIFEVLSSCLGASKTADQISKDVKNINGLQQVAINIKIRNRLFNKNRSAYASAGGSKISDIAVATIEKNSEEDIKKLVEYTRDGSNGLTIYPEF
jgi:hypothetical protein